MFFLIIRNEKESKIQDKVKVKLKEKNERNDKSSEDKNNSFMIVTCGTKLGFQTLRMPLFLYIYRHLSENEPFLCQIGRVSFKAGQRHHDLVRTSSSCLHTHVNLRLYSHLSLLFNFLPSISTHRKTFFYLLQSFFSHVSVLMLFFFNYYFSMFFFLFRHDTIICLQFSIN